MVTELLVQIKVTTMIKHEFKIYKFYNYQVNSIKIIVLIIKYLELINPLMPPRE